MSMWMSGASFVGGALAVAVINQVITRIFGGPRVDVAVADLSLSRTKHRAHRCIPVSEDLRNLLADGPTEHVDWDAVFISEHDIDFSILEMFEREHSYAQQKADLLRRQSLIDTDNVRKEVVSLGRNMSLVTTCLNGLIQFEARAPAVPAQGEQAEEVFKTHAVARTVEGRELEFIHLNLPGNPFPIIGSQEGRPEINEKAASLIYAMSHCDASILKTILGLAVEFCGLRIDACKRLRGEFERLKHVVAFLEIQILVSNRGKSPAYLSTFANITVGDTKDAVAMAVVDDSPQGDNPKWQIVARDKARRLVDWVPELKDNLLEYQGGVQNLAISPHETVTLHFVSDESVSREVVDAVNAMRTGYADCGLSLWQYLPRKVRWFPRAGRFVRKLQTVQKMTSVRS